MRRSLSLRARVAIAAALAATIVIAAIGIAFAVFVRVNATEQLDRTLNSVTLRLPSTAEPAQLIPAEPANEVGRSEPVAGVATRSRQVTVSGDPGAVIAVAVAEDPLRSAIMQQQIRVAIAAITAIAAAAWLGWLMTGRAVRPLQRLAEATRTTGDDPDAARPSVRGAREAEELSDAIGHMLDRIAGAQHRTAEALRSARDFASISAHELRTPLTSMRTDLEVLSTIRLTDAQRSEIHRDLLASQRQVETTLADLERLAIGELSDCADHEDVDLVELVDRCVQKAARGHPDLDFTFLAPGRLVVRGIPSGLRLVLDNAVTNAVRHGGARRVLVTVTPVAAAPQPVVVITVDDDGIGVPEAERKSVFGRFVRGAITTAEGSGLGLALIAQQATLHGGNVELAASPLGGARLMLRLPASSSPESTAHDRESAVSKQVSAF